ncbi:MAG: hypothetical protein IPM59_03675 [Chloracidobacterium sp.]|nr:hypothetical protein [Chloracidobacterium sp.]
MKLKLIYLTVALAAVFLTALTAVGHDDHDKKSPSPTPQIANTESNSAPPARTTNEHANMTMTPMNMVEDFPNYHPLVVHFPIVLLIFAGLFQALAFFVYKKELSFAALLLLFAGTVTVWLASNTFHAHPTNLPEHVNSIYETHELMAEYTWWLSLAALVAKGISHFFLNRKLWSEAVVLILLIGASITVSIVGHHGAQLVHMGGVGPQGKYLESH